MASPWPVDVLTPEYLISGDVAPGDQKWAWSYFNPYEKRPADALTVAVTAARSTGALPSPALIADRLAMRDVAIQRGDGDRIEAPRAIVWTRFVHTAIPQG
jgi:hypothetical protein